ncbi:hypothetical protein, partial [Mesorhizobium sp. M8A.F.Ca.ET.208.01.1.1]|uniref:hypothetical protein n=1 Tax=Mesorhizobium sp. M8A.F.Ca.ET.208.01.1.1 TaxID=2563969 RepID=UPI001AEEC1D3
MSDAMPIPVERAATIGWEDRYANRNGFIMRRRSTENSPWSLSRVQTIWLSASRNATMSTSSLSSTGS